MIFKNKGMDLESMLNNSNNYYLAKDEAVIYKKPTPIGVVKVSYSNNHKIINKGYFKEQSTLDYNGIYKGKYIDFEAKVTQNKTSFPLQNIHEHQMEYMQDFERQDGIAFLIVYFKEAGAYYYVPFRDVKRFWDRAAEGGRKSFLRHELDQDYQIRTSNQIFIHYLDALSRDLESRPES